VNNDENDDGNKAAEEEEEEAEGLKPLESMAKMVGMWQDPKMISIIPLIMYTGLEVSFIWSDFTTNYIANSLGIENIGYCMAIFGAADVVASIGLGKLSDVVGRPLILIVGAVCQGTILAVLFFLDLENCNQKWLIIIPCAVVWGFGDAAWNTQICSILGETFVDDKESAFANFKFWQSLTCAAAFGYIPAVTSKPIKLTILVIGLTAGMLGSFNLFRLKRLESNQGEFAYLHDKDQPETSNKGRKGGKGAKEPLLDDEDY
jgi:predicted MFS family arabinose efflux permease